MAVELNFEDLTDAAGGGAAGAEGPAAAVGDPLTAIDGVFEKVNGTINNLKELLSMLKGSGLMPAHNAGPQKQLYNPGPTLAQQLQRIVNLAYGAYGDITLTELIQNVLSQYGGLKLSDVLKMLGGEET